MSLTLSLELNKQSVKDSVDPFRKNRKIRLKNDMKVAIDKRNESNKKLEDILAIKFNINRHKVQTLVKNMQVLQRKGPENTLRNYLIQQKNKSIEVKVIYEKITKSQSKLNINKNDYKNAEVVRSNLERLKDILEKHFKIGRSTVNTLHKDNALFEIFRVINNIDKDIAEAEHYLERIIYYNNKIEYYKSQLN